MTAVTIGTGAYAEIAVEAATAMSARTGLRVRVLGDDIASRLKVKKPHRLKMELFNVIDDEDILYFDADLVALSNWSPQQFAGSLSVVAVRDLWFMMNIRNDAQRLGITTRNYFNSGLFILNRTAHASALNLASQLFEELAPAPFQDQSHLNLAFALMDVPIRFLDRRYNWIDYPANNNGSWRSPINCHFNVNAKGSKGLTLVRDATKQSPRTGKGAVREHLFESHSGLYSYERIGRDRRNILLARDGTIGYNWARMELYWYPYEENGRVFLAITSRDDITCILERNGDAWEGEWLQFEKMRISLRRPFHAEMQRP